MTPSQVARAVEITKNLGSDPEWRAFMDGVLARCAAARVKHVPLKFRPEAQELADADRAEGGPDLCKPLYGSL